MDGKIVKYDGSALYVVVPFSDQWILERQRISRVDVSLIDGRCISPEQRKKAYALFRDISLHTGYTPDEIKEVMKADYIAATGEQDFSLSDCTMTTARRFNSHLIEFCILHNIPCRDSLLDLAEDIGRYLYLCLAHRKCCICGRRAHVHHVDRLGMGADRKEVCHEGYEAMALCWRHHKEAHDCSKGEFNHKYHVYGIKLDDFLCKKLRLGRYSKNGN